MNLISSFLFSFLRMWKCISMLWICQSMCAGVRISYNNMLAYFGCFIPHFSAFSSAFLSHSLLCPLPGFAQTLHPASEFLLSVCAVLCYSRSCSRVGAASCVITHLPSLSLNTFRLSAWLHLVVYPSLTIQNRWFQRPSLNNFDF